jgi:hypothetical protein
MQAETEKILAAKKNELIKKVQNPEKKEKRTHKYTSGWFFK